MVPPSVEGVVKRGDSFSVYTGRKPHDGIWGARGILILELHAVYTRV